MDLDNCKVIQNVHMFSLKWFFNVPRSTPNMIVYGETGLYPLFINNVIYCVKYCLRLLRMEESRHPRKVYKTMLLDTNNSGNWTSKVKHLLCEYNFESIWEQQKVENETAFTNNFTLTAIREIRSTLDDEEN